MCSQEGVGAGDEDGVVGLDAVDGGVVVAVAGVVVGIVGEGSGCLAGGEG